VISVGGLSFLTENRSFSVGGGSFQTENGVISVYTDLFSTENEVKPGRSKKSYFCGDESGNIKKKDQYAGGKRASLDLCQRSK
jgi:hypothetical protein